MKKLEAIFTWMMPQTLRTMPQVDIFGPQHFTVRNIALVWVNYHQKSKSGDCSRAQKRESALSKTVYKKNGPSSVLFMSKGPFETIEMELKRSQEYCQH
jgi:hypothetical protein